MRCLRDDLRPLDLARAQPVSVLPCVVLYDERVRPITLTHLESIDKVLLCVKEVGDAKFICAQAVKLLDAYEHPFELCVLLEQLIVLLLDGLQLVFRDDVTHANLCIDILLESIHLAAQHRQIDRYGIPVLPDSLRKHFPYGVTLVGPTPQAILEQKTIHEVDHRATV